MKQFSQYIQEKLKVNSNSKVSKNLSAFDILVDTFKNIVIQEQLSDSDFERHDDFYMLYKIPQDPKYFKDFINEIEPYNDLYKFLGDQSGPYPDYYYTIQLKSDKKTFIIFNFSDHDSKKWSYKKGDIVSIDVSRNIKEALLK